MISIIWREKEFLIFVTYNIHIVMTYCLTAHQKSKRSFSSLFFWWVDDRIGYKLFHSFGTILYIIKVCVHYYIWEKIFWLCHSYLRFNIDHIARLSFYDYNLLFIVGYISYFFYLWNFDFHKYLWAEFSLFFFISFTG